jgi:hypothetical protein
LQRRNPETEGVRGGMLQVEVMEAEVGMEAKILEVM